MNGAAESGGALGEAGQPGDRAQLTDADGVELVPSGVVAVQTW